MVTLSGYDDFLRSAKGHGASERPMVALALLIFQAARPFATLPPPAASEARESLGVARSRIALDGDVLTVLCRSDAPQVVMQGGLYVKLGRIEGDLWGARLRMAGWDRAFFNYGFGADDRMLFRQGVWRGPHAPTPAFHAAHLRGRLVRTALPGPQPGTRRRIDVYLPPHPTKGMPTFYLADGPDCERYARVLEPLILGHRVRPCAIVGVDNAGYAGNLYDPVYDERKDLRMREYLPALDPERFARHLRFVADTVTAWAARTYGLSTCPEDRAVMGVSNGGVFAAVAALRRPDVFGTALPFSLGAPVTERRSRRLPQAFFAAGRLEHPLDDWTRALHARLPGSDFDLFISGHDPEMWDLAFARFAPKVFPVLK